MKQIGMVIATLVVAVSPAFADGFSCQNEAGDLAVKVYNNTDSDQGTRTAAVMIVSNPQIGDGNKTIAVFHDASGLLSSRGASFAADVDLRFTESSRKGELIGGTKLGQLKSITLDVDHSYNAPVAAGTELNGIVTLEKRDGKSVEINVDCVRYLKN